MTLAQQHAQLLAVLRRHALARRARWCEAATPARGARIPARLPTPGRGRAVRVGRAPSPIARRPVPGRCPGPFARAVASPLGRTVSLARALLAQLVTQAITLLRIEPHIGRRRAGALRADKPADQQQEKRQPQARRRDQVPTRPRRRAGGR